MSTENRHLRSRRPSRSVWTRLTGWAGLTLAWVLGLRGLVHDPGPARPRWVDLGLLLAVLACAGLWVLAHHKARPYVDDPEGRPSRPGRTSYLLPLSLAWCTAVLGAAGMTQATLPDRATAEWRQAVEDAGGGVREATVVRVVGEPVDTDMSVNDVPVYRSTLVFSVPFAAGAREVSLDGFETTGLPKPGEKELVAFAPDRPDLGVRTGEALDVSPGALFASFWILALGFFGGAFLTIGMYMGIEEVDDARRYQPRAHLPALGAFGLGAAAMVPFLLGFPSGVTAFLLGLVGMLAPYAGVCWAWYQSNEAPPWQIKDEAPKPTDGVSLRK
ncbi:hypothetical protein [Streptomyces sp. NPDC056144]|uniref:hypothetical protein n=1 Tax=unclassified Streptomyces TaxID=2593676 RepID=UPI0035E3352F